MKFLEQKLGSVLRENEQDAELRNAELTGMREALEAARRETAQLQAKENAAAEDFGKRLRSLEDHAAAVAAERQRAETERDSLAKAFADAVEDAKKAAHAHGEALANAEAGRTRQARELADAIRKKSDELESARAIIAVLERENAEGRTAHETTSRHRDEIAHRMTRVTDEHKRLLDELATSGPSESAPRSVLPAPAKPHNLVEMSEAEILPPQRERTINLQPARPVPVAPPKVRTV